MNCWLCAHCSLFVHCVNMAYNIMLPLSKLFIVFQTIVVNKLSYASIAWWVFTSADDRRCLEAFMRRSATVLRREDWLLDVRQHLHQSCSPCSITDNIIIYHSLGQLTSHITDLVSAKGKTKEVYCCDIVVLIVLLWCFWWVKDYKVESVYWNIVWWGCESIGYQSTDFCFPLCRN